MKKYFFLFCWIISINKLQAQQFNTDSLLHVAETTTNDSIRMNAMVTLLMNYDSGNLDSLILYSKKLIQYGQAHHLPHMEAWGDGNLGYAYYRAGNLAQMQAYFLKASAILDKYPDNFLQGFNATGYSFFQPNDSLQIVYLKKAIAYFSTLNKNNKFKNSILLIQYGNLSTVFVGKNKLDSALAYLQNAYDIAISDSTANAGFATIAALLSSIHSRLHQFDLAAAYAKMSLVAAQKYQDAEEFDMAYGAMATYFDSTHLQDSAFYYYSKMYNEPNTGWYRNKMAVANWLYKYYKQNHDVDSALKYASVYIVDNDSLNNIAQALQIEKVNLQENLRQQQLAAQKAKQKETEKHNIQFVVIAIGILVVIILFLLLSRSFMVSHKTIEVLGVIMLLIVFEFINLLLHDYLENMTHNSPLLMLLALVAVAALIVPFHHRLEKWATKKLVEKNKEVRLAKAKHIVEQLESKK